ncbi:hypothetical protein ACWDYH_35610 [Nocardia goodfellowii]
MVDTEEALDAAFEKVDEAVDFANDAFERGILPALQAECAERDEATRQARERRETLTARAAKYSVPESDWELLTPTPRSEVALAWGVRPSANSEQFE